MTTCDVCGAPLGDGVAACARCGTPVVSAPPTEWGPTRPAMGLITSTGGQRSSSLSPYPSAPSASADGSRAGVAVVASIFLVAFVAFLGGGWWLTHRTADDAVGLADASATSTTSIGGAHPSSIPPSSPRSGGPDLEPPLSLPTLPGAPPWACALQDLAPSVGAPLDVDDAPKADDVADAFLQKHGAGGSVLPLDREASSAVYAIVDTSGQMETALVVERTGASWNVEGYLTCRH